MNNMLAHDSEGVLRVTGKPIVNTKTLSKYIADDVRVVTIDGKKYIHPVFSKESAPLKLFELKNWEIMNKKDNTEVKVTESNIVGLDKLKVTPDTDTFNILLITYLKEMSNGRILTTNQKRLKHLLSILEKKPESPISWKYVDDLLKYVDSNKGLFFKWMGEEKGKSVLNKYVNFNK